MEKRETFVKFAFLIDSGDNLNVFLQETGVVGIQIAPIMMRVMLSRPDSEQACSLPA
jgi:hypothetical protein